MTKQEWTQLARETKQNGTYYQLIKAITTHWKEHHDFTTQHNSNYKIDTIETWIEKYLPSIVKSWYQQYYTYIKD